MKTIKTIIVLLCLFVSGSIYATTDGDKSFTKEGNIYSSTGRQVANSKPIATGCTWVDSKGNKYPIYMSASTGSCYVIKTSAKTGKEYKSYLKPDVSKDICAKLGKEYKGKSK